MGGDILRRLPETRQKGRSWRKNVDQSEVDAKKKRQIIQGNQREVARALYGAFAPQRETFTASIVSLLFLKLWHAYNQPLQFAHLVGEEVTAASKCKEGYVRLLRIADAQNEPCARSFKM